MTKTIITGIDTDVGKTYVTGLIARYMFEKGDNITTFKVVQTGCENIAEDIITHRNIMGVSLSKEDKENLTCPEIFKYPASPHLAAKLENREVSLGNIKNALLNVSKRYDKVLIEGVGGVFVPLIGTYTLLDFFEELKSPCIVVSTPKLGSINHTLMTLDVLKSRKIPIKGLVYNLCINEKKEILEDSKNVFKKFHPDIEIIEIPYFDLKNPPNINFSSFNL